MSLHDAKKALGDYIRLRKEMMELRALLQIADLPDDKLGQVHDTVVDKLVGEAPEPPPAPAWTPPDPLASPPPQPRGPRVTSMNTAQSAQAPIGSDGVQRIVVPPEHGEDPNLMDMPSREDYLAALRSPGPARSAQPTAAEYAAMSPTTRAGQNIPIPNKNAATDAAALNALQDVVSPAPTAQAKPAVQPSPSDGVKLSHAELQTQLGDLLSRKKG